MVGVKGEIRDMGWGLGGVWYMVWEVWEEGEIRGIDYDEEKIGVGEEGWVGSGEVEFV